MAGKPKKPFVSRKKRREIQESLFRREQVTQKRQEDFRARESARVVSDGEKKPVTLPSVLTVGDFAQRLNTPVVAVISQLVKNGVMASITQQIDFETMAIIADELGFIPEEQSGETNAEQITPSRIAVEGSEVRPPVVTIMGHVDHGKTSLLDRIRQTNIAGAEHGGITQHIGAYQTEISYEGKNRQITFLDTPGHEAFTAMRSHGAQVTDFVVLVVAADDGVKPQTIEAINHAKNANVPIIVAITKSDLPSANFDRVKQQLTEHGLIPEEWGGDTIVTNVSSTTGDGIKQLLEYIILKADLRGHTADPSASPQGVVIESHQEPGLGSVATILVQNGTLCQGDVVLIGHTYGKIRSMTNYLGERIIEAGPSTPVIISGLRSIPQFGQPFVVTKNEKEARDLAAQSVNQTSLQRRSLSDISKAIAEGRTDSMRIVLKADTQGSLEALHSSILKLHQPGVKPLIINEGIGDVSLSDIQLAAASNAVVLGFHVAVASQVKKAAATQGVTVSTFKIIYDLLNQVELTLKGLIKIEKIKVEKGRLKVLKIFRTSKEAQIIGGEITQGLVMTPSFITITRDGEVVGSGSLITLQKGPEIVEELESGQQCGMSVASTTKIQIGDVLIVEAEEEIIATNAVETN